MVEVTPEHLLIGLLKDDETTECKALIKLGMEQSRLESEVQSKDPILPKNSWAMSKKYGAEMQLSRRGKRAIDACYLESRIMCSNKIDTGHLLLGILREGGSAAQILLTNGVTLDGARAVVTPSSSEDNEGEE